MFSIVSILTIAVATALSICAQAAPPIPKLPSRATAELTGVVRIPKEFGIVPASPGVNQPNALPCAPYWVAILDPLNLNKVLAVTESRLEPGRDMDNFYTCKYSSLLVRANNRYYAIAGMGDPSQAPQGSRWPMYITDAWIGGTNNKPPRGYERGFAGRYVTLGTGVKATYLKFDMYYAQVDPN